MENSKEKCGIIMPISAMAEYEASHWNDVKSILNDAIETANFSPNLVSKSESVGVIQKEIVRNLYSNPIVVCDVSGHNPNVMFELGLRLAFDKPTIIVKDNCTDYNFDTSNIRHLVYPKNLHYQSIVQFKKELAKLISSTIEQAKNEPEYSTFLKNYGDFTLPKLESTEIPMGEYIVKQLNELKSEIQDVKIKQSTINNRVNRTKNRYVSITIPKYDADLTPEIDNVLSNYEVDYSVLESPDRNYHILEAKIFNDTQIIGQLKSELNKISPSLDIRFN